MPKLNFHYSRTVVVSCLNAHSRLFCCSHEPENWVVVSFLSFFFSFFNSNYDVLCLVAMTIRILFGLLGGNDNYSSQAESV